jgi:uncharacterized protein (TIGR03086 family)
MDPIAQLQRSLRQTAVVLDNAAGAAPEAPTPCRAWTVADLVDHVVFDTSQFAVAARGERPDWTLTPPRVESPYGAVFRPGADRLIAAWRDSGDLDRVITLPIGERPASFALSQQTAEFAVHAWDVAVATGQRVDWDDELAEAALTWSKTALLPALRGENRRFAAEVPIADEAPAQDRLVAWFGRSPQ